MGGNITIVDAPNGGGLLKEVQKDAVIAVAVLVPVLVVIIIVLVIALVLSRRGRAPRHGLADTGSNRHSEMKELE